MDKLTSKTGTVHVAVQFLWSSETHAVNGALTACGRVYDGQGGATNRHGITCKGCRRTLRY